MIENIRIYEKIKTDPYILNIYSEIESQECNETFWAYHGLTHIDNVIEMVEKILNQLGYDQEYIENAKIAALLHDLGMIDGKKGHCIRSYELAKKYFEDNNIKLKYKDEVLDAIRAHSDKFDSNNVMAIVLIFADKIDIKKTRLAPKGYEVVGLRQYQFIEDINILKNNNDLRVQFVVQNDCDKKELEDYYFTPKVFNAIKSFANYFELNLRILWNKDEWVLNS